MRKRRRRWLALASVTAFALGGGVAYASIPDSAGVIHACYVKSGGALRVVDSACKSSETSLSWNQNGVPGPAGPAGPPGAPGPAGPPGPAGTGVQFAVVGADGTLARGSTGVTSQLLDATNGRYQVNFGHDVSACAYTATAGDVAAGALAAPFVVTVATRAGNVNAVFVQTWQTNGTGTPVSFHLMVAC